jgi:hypothetical protein
MQVRVLMSSEPGIRAVDAASVVVIVVLSIDLLKAQVAHSYHRIGAKARPFDDVGRTSRTENLATDSTMMLTPPGSKDTAAVIAVGAWFVRHPIILA